jgi:hypothetical protein
MTAPEEPDERDDPLRGSQAGRNWGPAHGFEIDTSPTGQTHWLSDEQPRPVEALTATVRPVPEDQLRRWSLVGIGSVIVLSLFVVALGMAFRWFSEEFAKTLLQLFIPPLLSAFAVVVGYLFAERKRG